MANVNPVTTPPVEFIITIALVIADWPNNRAQLEDRDVEVGRIEDEPAVYAVVRIPLGQHQHAMICSHFSAALAKHSRGCRHGNTEWFFDVIDQFWTAENNEYKWDTEFLLHLSNEVVVYVEAVHHPGPPGPPPCWYGEEDLGDDTGNDSSDVPRGDIDQSAA